MLLRQEYFMVSCTITHTHTPHHTHIHPGTHPHTHTHTTPPTHPPTHPPTQIGIRSYPPLLAHHAYGPSEKKVKCVQPHAILHLAKAGSQSLGLRNLRQEVHELLEEQKHRCLCTHTARGSKLVIQGVVFRQLREESLMLVFCGAGVPSGTSFGEANHNKQFTGTKFDVVLDQRQNINVTSPLTARAVNLFPFSFFTHTQRKLILTGQHKTCTFLRHTPFPKQWTDRQMVINKKQKLSTDPVWVIGAGDSSSRC